MSKSPADAEDAVQEIFLEVWRHAVRFDESKGSEQAFIATLARRRLIDRLRKASAEPLTNQEMDVFERASVQQGNGNLAAVLDAETAIRAMGSLREDFREVLELAFLEGLTQVQIARRMEKPLGTIKSCMRRALLQLRVAMTHPAAASAVLANPSPLSNLAARPFFRGLSPLEAF